MSSVSLNWWRSYFRDSNSDIFEIIEKAIIVAASDCPKEFRARRDGIAELLFSCKTIRCSRCSNMKLAVPGNERDEEFRSNGDEHGCDSEVRNNEISKGNSTVTNLNHVSNFSFGEAEALTNEIEEENEICGEVLRIKKLLHNWENESESTLFESLRRLELMSLNVDTLTTTEVGKAVNPLRKHGSQQICHLSRILIEGWKEMVDEWMNATTTITDGTPDSVNPCTVDEEEGLPSPPLDEGVFFAAQTSTPLEFTEFFSGMDDDGNPQANVESNQKLEMVPRKPTKPRMLHRMKNDETKHREETNNPLSQRKQRENLEDATETRFEAAKKRLRERYEEAEKAKKQRRIQVMELDQIPKRAPGHNNLHAKSRGRPSANKRW